MYLDSQATAGHCAAKRHDARQWSETGRPQRLQRRGPRAAPRWLCQRAWR